MKEEIEELLNGEGLTVNTLLAHFTEKKEKAEKTLTFLLSEEIICLKDGILCK